MKNRVFLLFFGVGLLSVVSLNAQPPKSFDKYVDSVLSAFEVPGMSIAVVQNGKTVIAKGYGVKKLGEPAKVDAHTLFPIASNTKAFTAMALALLADEGKIKWDDPVINYLPWFRMSDPWVTSQITIRDLLVHHSGIPGYAGDILLFPPSRYTRKEILEKLQHIPIIASFRTTYAYDNILYVAAGELIKEVSKIDYEDFISTRIFATSSMNESIARFTDLRNKANRSMGHSRLRNKVTPVSEYLDQIIGDAGNPAGGICSNAEDMARWMLAELDAGKNHSEVLWQMVTPITIPELSAPFKRAQKDFYGYALGVRVANYGRYKTISHGGSLDGFVSHVILVPALQLGITVLTNQESSDAYFSVIYPLLDHYMKLSYYNWLKVFKEQTMHSKEKWTKDWEAAQYPVSASSKSLPEHPEQFSGTFSDPLFGDVTLTCNADSCTISAPKTPQLSGTMSTYQNGNFLVSWRNKSLKADAWMAFTFDPNGNAESFQMKVIDPSCDISFEGLTFKRNKK